MRLKVTDDGKFLQVVSGSQLEIEQLEVSFAKKVDNYFIIKKKVPHWNGIVRFIDQYSRIPLGLWGEVKKLGEKYNFPISIDKNNFITDSDYSAEDLEEWIEDHFKNSKIKPRYYQTEAVKRALYFLNCTEEISTSGGKTLISYMLFRYLYDRKKIKRMLYVVPNVGLVEQSEDKFYDYDEACGLEPNWISQCVFGGAKKRRNEDEANVVFGTYQSLGKKDLDYFSKFDVVMVDECLHPDTLITMSDFSKKKIKDIEVGELVWTVNDESGDWEIKPVDFVYHNLSKNNQMYEIELENGKTINITGNHKVFTKGRIWKRVDELTEKDEIISIDMMDI